MEDDRELEGLVKASVLRDTEAFARLGKLLSQKLFAYLYSRTNTREQAVDALQDTLVDLWYALNSFSYTSPEGFWRFTYTIAKRKGVQVRSRNHTSLEEVGEQEDAQTAQALYDRELIQFAVRKLGPPDSDILSLRHWSEYSFEEIGEMLNMNAGAVRVRHHRALEKLKRMLHNYET